MQSITNNNAELRARIRRTGRYFWEVADVIGVHEVTLSMWLRRELPADSPRRKRIEAALQELERTGGRHGEEETKNTAVSDR